MFLITLLIGLIGVLVFLSTFESAVTQLGEVQLRVLRAENERSFHARFLRELVENRHRLLLTVSMGVQLMIISLTITLVTLLQSEGREHPLLMGLVGMVLVVSVFRQFLPRMLAQNNPEKVLLRLLPALSAVYNLLWPLAYPIYRALQSVKTASVAEPAGEEGSDEEIQAFIDVGEEAGIIEESEGQLIQSIVELGDKQVRELMIPRSDIIAVDAGATVGDAIRVAVESNFSRLPVYKETLDDVIGIVYLRDLLKKFLSGGSAERVTGVMRPAYFVPETKRAADLLDEMKRARTHIALAVDEYGGIAGLITLEDMIEEIVGPIEDEDQPVAADIIAQPDGSVLVRGTTDVRKLELLFRTEIDADDFTTVAGLILKHLDHLPAVGEGVQCHGLRFEVVDADPRRIRMVRIRPIAPIPSGSDAEARSISVAKPERP